MFWIFVISITLPLPLPLAQVDKSSMAEVKLFRAWLPGNRKTGHGKNVVLVHLKKDSERFCNLACFAQQVLGLWSCKNLGDEWPPGEIQLRHVLKSADPSLDGWSEWTSYIHHVHEGKDLHGLGIASNKSDRRKANLLAITLAGLLTFEEPSKAFPDFAGPGALFEKEVALIRKLKPTKIEAVAGATLRPCTAFAAKKTNEDGTKLPEEPLLRQWQGVLPWVPEDPHARLVKLADLQLLDAIHEDVFQKLLALARVAFQDGVGKLRKPRGDPCRWYFDITKSVRPWPFIVAAHSERATIVKNGVSSFHVVMDERLKHPFAEEAPVFFEAKQPHGQVHTFHSLDRTHQTMRQVRTEEDEQVAFRLLLGEDAASTSCGMDVMSRFRKERRPKACWKVHDFIPPGCLLAWTASNSLKDGLMGWLLAKQPVDRNSEDANQPPSLRDELLRECERSQVSKSNFGKLDPSVDARAHSRFQHLMRTFCSDDPSIVYSHCDVADKFTHGHRGGCLSDLTSQLEAGKVDALSIPALVCVKHKGQHCVIMGNRRLLAYKNCKTPVYFRMIVHKLDDLRDMDADEREAFKVKALSAATTTTGGQHVAVRGCSGGKVAAKARPKRPLELPWGEMDPAELGLTPCAKPKPAKKAMPKPTSKSATF